MVRPWPFFNTIQDAKIPWVGRQMRPVPQVRTRLRNIPWFHPDVPFICLNLRSSFFPFSHYYSHPSLWCCHTIDHSQLLLCHLYINTSSQLCTRMLSPCKYCNVQQWLHISINIALTITATMLNFYDLRLTKVEIKHLICHQIFLLFDLNLTGDIHWWLQLLTMAMSTFSILLCTGKFHEICYSTVRPHTHTHTHTYTQTKIHLYICRLVRMYYLHRYYNMHQWTFTHICV